MYRNSLLLALSESSGAQHRHISMHETDERIQTQIFSCLETKDKSLIITLNLKW